MRSRLLSRQRLQESAPVAVPCAPAPKRPADAHDDFHRRATAAVSWSWPHFPLAPKRRLLAAARTTQHLKPSCAALAGCTTCWYCPGLWQRTRAPLATDLPLTPTILPPSPVMQIRPKLLQ